MTTGMFVVACFAARATNVLSGHQNVDFETHEIGSKLVELVASPCGTTAFDDPILAFHVPKVIQSRPKQIDFPVLGTSQIPKPTDAEDLPRLLRLHGERHGEYCHRPG